MDTALVTGMLGIKVLPEKRVEKDVEQVSVNGFGEIFEKSLKNKEVENKEVKTNDEVKQTEVKSKECKDEEVESKDVDELEDETSKKEKDNKKVKEEITNDNIIINEFVKIIKFEDVEEKVDLSNKEVLIEDVGLVRNNSEEKLNGLLEKLDVELNKNVEIKDESENVIEVGPQLVETEKIKLNTKDVEKSFKDLLNDKDLKNENEVLLSDDKAEFDLSRLEKLLNEKVGENKDVEGMLENIKIDVIENKNINESISNEETKELNTKDVLNIKDVKNNKELKESQDVSLKDKVVNNFEKKDNDGSLFDKDSDSKSGEKQSKLKIKDLQNKEHNSFLDRIMGETEVELENKFEIKEVNNIQKFENINIEQADILDQVTEKLEVSLFDNKSEMVIKLKPYDLGKVTVKISIENGVMNAKFLADSIKVKETLESSLNNLKESLKDQGLNVQNLSVSVDSGKSQNQNFEQNNLRYINTKKDYRVNDSVGYEDDYSEVDMGVSRITRNRWMNSTVSFLA